MSRRKPVPSPPPALAPAPRDPVEEAIDALLGFADPKTVVGLFDARTRAVAAIRALIGATPERIEHARRVAEMGLAFHRDAVSRNVDDARHETEMMRRALAEGKVARIGHPSGGESLARSYERAEGYRMAASEILGALGVKLGEDV